MADNSYSLVGTGKTFLTCRVIDHLSRSLDDLDQKEYGFAFFYCNRIEQNRSDFFPILKSLLRQLGSSAARRHMIRENLFHARPFLREASELAVNTCVAQLRQSVDLYRRTTIVLDALDECNLETRRQLVQLFNLLISKGRRPVRIFVSSRPDPDTRQYLDSWPMLEIQRTDNEQDIGKFISKNILQHPGWKGMSETRKNEIIRIVQDKSMGM